MALGIALLAPDYGNVQNPIYNGIAIAFPETQVG